MKKSTVVPLFPSKTNNFNCLAISEKSNKIEREVEGAMLSKSCITLDAISSARRVTRRDKSLCAATAAAEVEGGREER